MQTLEDRILEWRLEQMPGESPLPREVEARLIEDLWAEVLRLRQSRSRAAA